MERDAEKANGFQAMINNLAWDNSYTEKVSGPTKGDAILDIYLLRLASWLISCHIFPEISDHNGILLEVEWDKICRQLNSPGLPQNRCIRLARLSSGKVYRVGWKWQLHRRDMEKL